jgi:hypothetical protein
MSDSVGRHLDQLFEQGDPPAGQGSKGPRAMREMAQMSMPDHGHENIATEEHYSSHRIMRYTRILRFKEEVGANKEL